MGASMAVVQCPRSAVSYTGFALSLLNQVIEFVKVIGSAVGGANTTTLYNVTGIGGFAVDDDGLITGEDETDDGGEQAHEQECFTALGMIGRPLPPEGDLFTEALTVRTGDGLVPFAFRDLRLNRAINPSGAAVTPAEGQLLFVGYGGAFLSHAMTAEASGSKRANVSTLYVPYNFDSNGVPQNAHAITIDPTTGNSSISIVHGDGVFLTLTEDAGGGAPGIVWSTDESTFGRMSAGEFVVNAAKITLKGNCYLGAQAEVGLPLLAGPASPPSPSVFVSPV
jgi:hypothetical protein